MWLAARIQHVGRNPEEALSELLDLSLSLSPHVSLAPQDQVLFSLASLSRYWSLPTLQAGEHLLSEHKFLQALEPFSKRYHMRFTLAPTAAWALWLNLLHPPSKLLRRWDRDDIVALFYDTHITKGRLLLCDDMERDSNLSSVFDFVCEKLMDLGVRDLGALIKIAASHERRKVLGQNLGSVFEKFLRRLKGSDDFAVKWHVPKNKLKDSFHPGLEDEMSSEEARSGTLDRIYQMLQQWEARLQARRSLLTGLRLRIQMERKRDSVHLELPLPKATREAKTLFKILQERWLKLAEATGKKALPLFEDEIFEVDVESIGLTPDHDRQLNLFDPYREETEEQWNALIGRLRAQSPSQKSLRIGIYQAHESYFPENALEWVEWEEVRACAPVAEHPRRPTLLLSPPQVQQEGPRSEEEFLSYVAKQGAAMTLERVRDPWRSESECERTYARVENKWYFWDPAQQRMFLHGFFE